MIQPIIRYSQHKINRDLAITKAVGGAALIGTAILGGAGVLPMPAAMGVTFAVLSFSSLSIAITPVLVTAVIVGLIGCALLVYASLKIKEHQNILSLWDSFKGQPEILRSISMLTPSQKKEILNLPVEERKAAITEKAQSNISFS